MYWRLGLDVGTSSLGWAVLRLKNPKNPDETELVDMGVRIFNNGRNPKDNSPLNVQRRDARQARRQRDRKIRRRKVMRNYLIQAGLLPASQDKKAISKSDPYMLRAQALERKLDSEELGRVLMHFSVRRGFKSNRKEQIDEKEKEGMLGGIQKLESILGRLTLGQWLNDKKAKGELVRFRPVIEKGKIQYSFYPSRAMYEAEFEKIKTRQIEYYPNLNWDRLHWLIFFQRPLKPQERGRCQFYTDEPRGFKALSSAHKFRILQDLNNLCYYDASGKKIELDSNIKKELYQYLDTHKVLTFEKIKKQWYKTSEGYFNLESERRIDLKGNATACDMRNEKYFGQRWDTIPLDEQDEIVDLLITEEQENKIYEKISVYNLSEDQKKNICGINFSTGTTSLSTKFMRACSEIMLDNFCPYHVAVEALCLHHSQKEAPALRQSLPYYGKILEHAVMRARPELGESVKREEEELRYGRIPNPTVHIALRQIQKLVNALIRRFGNPSEIVVELARELKQNDEQRRKTEQEQTKNQKQNERIKGEIQALGYVEVSKEMIKKYKLWEELGAEELPRKCPYCGKIISAKQLFTEEIEIEHILPFSKTFRDGMDNLTVAHRQCNQAKGNRSPHEAFGSSPAGHEWSIVSEIAARLPANKRRKFAPDAMDDLLKDKDFLQNQLTDNAYIARITKEYLSAVCPTNSIWPTTGRLTSMLRAYWGLNTVLSNNPHDKWTKNRSDHRHHAIDALVIGLSTRSIIQKTAQKSGAHYHKLEFPECPIQRRIAEAKIESMLVSLKPDHGLQGKLYAETAMGKHPYEVIINPTELVADDIATIVPLRVRYYVEKLVDKLGFKKARDELAKTYKYLRVFRYSWVSRAGIDAVSKADITSGRICDARIRDDLVKMYTEKQPDDKKLKELLLQYGEQHGIRTIRLMAKDQTADPIASAPYKAYSPDDFLFVDIWRIPEKNSTYRYEGVFVSRVQAWRIMNNIEQLRKPHPAAKYCMRLYKGDMLVMEKENQTPVYCVVKGFATTFNKIDVQPLFSANSITEWKNATNNKLIHSYWPEKCDGQYHRSINALFEKFTIKKLYITVDGRKICR